MIIFKKNQAYIFIQLMVQNLKLLVFRESSIKPRSRSGASPFNRTIIVTQLLDWISFPLMTLVSIYSLPFTKQSYFHVIILQKRSRKNSFLIVQKVEKVNSNIIYQDESRRKSNNNLFQLVCLLIAKYWKTIISEFKETPLMPLTNIEGIFLNIFYTYN